MKVLTPMRAIRAKCIDCCCGNPLEPKLCTAKESCPLWPYRLGHRPPKDAPVVEGGSETETAEGISEYHIEI